MKNNFSKLFLFIALCMNAMCVLSQGTIAQPYFADKSIRFYNKTAIVAASPCYTLNLTSDANAAWASSPGLNAVVIYQNKLFASFASNTEGGVLVYNYADVYPAKVAGPIAILRPQSATGIPTTGITIQPSTGDLFIATVLTSSASDAGIYTCTAASGYANSSMTQFMSYNNDQAIAANVADMAFDASGNLWFTSFFDYDAVNFPTPSQNNFLTCIQGLNKFNYYKIVNPTTKNYTATATSGSSISTYLLSQPEGLIFDASGNLWIGNNNDDQACNNSGEGTLVKINASWITGTLFGMATGNSTGIQVPAAQVDAKFIPTGKLGGLMRDGNIMYINDQGQNQGSSYTTNGTVWKWDVTTTFNATNFTASGIHTTYPGNGLMALNNAQFPMTGSCSSTLSSAKDILTFTIPTQIGSSTINATNATVSLIVPSSTNLTSLTPTFTVSANATASPLSGVAQNFSAPKTYIITAQDGTTKTWTITVSKQASASTATLPNPCLIGYLHNWDDAANGNPYIQLDNVDSKYNVINYAFANTNGNGSNANVSLILDPAVDANAATRTATFITKMQTVQGQGRKVMISLGGAVAQGGLIQLNTVADRNDFIASVENILTTYPFDGVDINFEGQCFIFGNQTTGTIAAPNSPTIDNFVYAMKQIMTYYRTLRGKKMLLTFAPERQDISGGRSNWQMTNLPEAAAYLPVITALKDSLDAVHVQLYGVQGDYSYLNSSTVFNAGTVDGALANLENIMYGYNLDVSGVLGKGIYAGIPASKTVMAVAGPCAAASPGFLDTTQIKQVVNYLKGAIPQPGAYPKQNAAATTLRGMMVWSINYDANTTCSRHQVAAVYTELFNPPALSSAKDILTFSIPTQVGTSTINATAGTIAVLMPSSANLASLIPTFTVSANATASPVSGVAQNFTTAFTYIVTAQDGSTKNWIVTVTKQTALSSAKDILTFSIPTQVGTSTINATAGTIAVLMPSSANLASLIPTFTISANATASPVSGVAQNFTTAFTYIVTAQDGSTKNWIVTVTKQTALSSAKDILTFSIPTQVGTSTINATAGTIAVLMPSSANLASLIPTFTVSANATASPVSGVAQNFSSAFTYTVTAQDGSTKNWIVTVTKQTALSSAKDILTFSIPTQVGTSTINATAGTIAVLMPSSANLASLIPTFTISANATASPVSGVAQNFTTAFTYVVTAQDGSTKNWIVTVTKQTALSSAKDILTFSIPTQVGTSTINATAGTIAVLMPSSANLASLIPTFTVSANATASPVSGVAQNFTTAFTYIVTAQDGSTKNWIVTVTKQATGVENILLNALKIYPNPTTNFITIEQIGEVQIDKLVLTNLVGEIIMDVPFEEKSKTISIADFANGIYLIHLTDKEKNQAVFKISKN